MLKRFRDRGWLEQEAVDLFVKLFEAVPGPADLVRFMLRDVEDPNIVDRFSLDAEFDDKYKGQVKSWFNSQGVSEKLALYEWRAHWQNMPWTQLQQMQFRLRPDKVNGAKDPAGYPLAVTPADVFAALGQNDVPPYWRYKLMEVSYNLPRLIDVRRAYFAGVLDDAAIRSDLLDRGLSPESADLLVPVYRRLRRDGLRRDRVVRLYQSDALGEDRARALLAADGYTDVEIDAALDWADVEANAAVTAKCVKQISARFTRGEIPREDLPTVLSSFGLSPKQIARVVRSVTCTLATKPKDLTAAQICDFHSRGILSDQTALDRLLRLGYSADDAARMFARCQQTEAEKAAKAQAKADKAAGKGKKSLTQGQILRLLARGEITRPDAVQRLVDSGLRPDDAAKLVAAALAKA